MPAIGANELICEASRRHDSWQVFGDFIAMAAISLMELAVVGGRAIIIALP